MCEEDEVTRRVEGGFLMHVVRTTFFGVKKSDSFCSSTTASDEHGGQHPHGWGGMEEAYPISRPLKELEKLSGVRGRLPETMSRSRIGSVADLTDLTGGVNAVRLAKGLLKGHGLNGTSLLDQGQLRAAILPLVCELTFLEAYNVSGRILNICVSRSDGKADSLMCNYLTTPQMLIYSACLASCAIPGVYEPVELLAKNKDGETTPYFKSGCPWRWTDGGLQADLPKARLSELFNVNQFIVSQVNPLAPLFVPWLTEAMGLLRNQLVGFVHGTSMIAQGRLVRPGGIRLVDVLMQARHACPHLPSHPPSPP